MFFKYILIFIFPTLVHSRINIKITPAGNIANASVEYTGENTAIISDQERESFQLDDDSLKSATKVLMGKKCSDVFVKRPTPWEDVYRKFGWKQVQRTLKPVKARILGINAKPSAIATNDYTNTRAANKVKYKASVFKTVQETVTHTWSKGKELSVGKDLTYSVNFGKGSIGGKTGLTYTSKWGNNTAQGRTLIIGTTSSVEVEIPPGDGVLATLITTQGTMDVEVDYEATVDGQVFCNYDKGYKGHHWYALPVKVLQRKGNLPTSVKSTEIISVGFYTNMRIEISELETKTVIKNEPAGVVKVLHS